MLALDYLLFLLKSKNRHGVHSPFVYDLNSKGLNPKLSREDKMLLKAYESDLKKLSPKLSPSEYGAGSVFKANHRTVWQEAKRAGSRGKKASTLVKLSRYFKPETSLELGTSVGLGSTAILTGHRSQRLITIEGDKDRSKISNKLLKKHFPDSRIDCLCTDFESFLAEDTLTYQMIFIDGNHGYEATLDYFKWAMKHIDEQGMIIFDDIYWSKDMKKVWKRIVQDSDVHVSIDLFFMGLVWKRPQQTKQHFLIRA